MIGDKGTIKPTVPGTMDLVPSAIEANWHGDPRKKKKEPAKPKRVALWVRLWKRLWGLSAN